LGCGIPIIFITAYENQDSRQRAMQAGADAFLGKPFSEEDPLRSIRSALRQEAGVTNNLIAIVDDDESVRRTTSLLVESFGFQAAVFESAESFLNSGQLQHASCLIVDVQMPGMNGFQLQRHLAAVGCDVPIVFITAYDDKESRQRAMQAGAVAFLGKPFSDEHLLQTIRSALRQDKGGTKTT
jgi:FixJ family two-component response regulator